MDDVLKRLGAVESTVAAIKAEVSGLTATVAHLATKSGLADVRTELAQMESSLIKWMVGTMIAAVSMAFVIARYVTP